MSAHRDTAGDIDQILSAAAELGRRGVLSASGHGNISVRHLGSGEILYTAHPSLNTLRSEHIARLTSTGEVLSGSVPALSADAVRMHVAVYQVRPELTCVIHAHSPFATAYAVAAKPIGCWAEPMSIFGMPQGVPLAPYARRGSDRAARVIAESCAGESVRALLLQNHGVLGFGNSPAAVVHILTVVEEAAQLGITAEALGGPVPLPAGEE